MARSNCSTPTYEQLHQALWSPQYQILPFLLSTRQRQNDITVRSVTLARTREGETFVGQPFLKLCHSVPVDKRKDLKTSSQKNQEQLLAICKRIEQLGGELPMNWLDCELIYLERFAQKLQRSLDRQVIGF